MVTGKMTFPGSRKFEQFLDRFSLQGFLDFIDSSHRRTDAAHFALVLAADDFLEDPLDHIRKGRRFLRLGGEGIHRLSSRCKR